jgi:hypothetical protein
VYSSVCSTFGICWPPVKFSWFNLAARSKKRSSKQVFIDLGEHTGQAILLNRDEVYTKLADADNPELGISLNRAGSRAVR